MIRLCYLFVLTLLFVGGGQAVFAQNAALANINTIVSPQDCERGTVCVNIYNNETTNQVVDVSLLVLDQGEIISNELYQTLTVKSLAHESLDIVLSSDYASPGAELYVVVTNQQGLPLSRVKAGLVNQFTATTTPTINKPQTRCDLDGTLVTCTEVDLANTPEIALYQGSVAKTPLWQTLVESSYDLQEVQLDPGPYTVIVTLEDMQILNTVYIQEGTRPFSMIALGLDRDSYKSGAQAHISSVYSGGGSEHMNVSYQIQSAGRVCIEQTGVALRDKIVTPAISGDCSEAQLSFKVVDQQGEEVFSQGVFQASSLVGVLQNKGEKSFMIYGIILFASLIIIVGIIIAAVRIRGMHSSILLVLALSGVGAGMYYEQSWASAFVSEDKPQYGFTVDTNKQHYELEEDVQFSFSVTNLDTLQTPSPLSVFMKVNNGPQRQLLDRDTRRSFMYSFEIPNNELYEGRNQITFTIPGFCGSYYNHSSFDNAVFGTWDCQFTIDVQVGEVCSAPDDPACTCIDESWFASPDEICLGVDFTQTSNCLRTRDAVGTKTDGECALCINSSWGPSTDSVCAGVDFVQTSNCGLTRFAQGTKYGDGCAPLVTANANDFECSLNTINWERCDGNTYIVRTPQQGIYVRPVSGAAESWNINQTAAQLTGVVVDTTTPQEHLMQFTYLSPAKLYQNVVVTMNSTAGVIQQTINIKLIDVTIIEE